jgi:hypothetical protein
VSVVVEGADREKWLARTTNPRILEQSCQVCLDTGSAGVATPARSAPRPAAGSTDGDGGLKLAPKRSNAAACLRSDRKRTGGAITWENPDVGYLMGRSMVSRSERSSL